ncbi:MAG: hypothetical protein RLZ44_893 [Pseudomonadota bacterium]
MTQHDGYSLMVHGGAGTFEEVHDEASATRYLEGVRRVLEHGRDLLRRGESALHTVESCAALLEDDPLFNAGRGAVLNEDGKAEMDAAIMDGRDLSAGAVAAVRNIRNPIQLARLVMGAREHVMLVGDGAMRFAEHCGVARAPDSYFCTAERLAELEQIRRRQGMLRDHDGAAGEDGAHGTIGAIARDRAGNLAAATSTGGTVNKRQGRVGDSPLIGAGVYADNQTCAVSATGVGEELMRTVIAKTIADLIDLQGLDAAQATAAGIAYLARKVRGRGGVIVIDHAGRCAGGFTTQKMLHGWIEHGGAATVRF